MSTSFDKVTQALDKIVETQILKDIHYALLWNLDQLALGITDTRNTFRSSELTTTLLEQGILSHDLVDGTSLNRIVSEGLKSFPQLEFPIKITRYTIDQIIPILNIERVGHLKFVMVIPLMHKQIYETHSIVAHPVQLGPSSLVIPELRNTLLTNNSTYIITDKINMYSITPRKHLLLEVETNYNVKKSTCEWEGFQKNATAMLKLCNYKKAGQLPDTFVTETEQHRLIYFTEQTSVTLDCPKPG